MGRPQADLPLAKEALDTGTLERLPLLLVAAAPARRAALLGVLAQSDGLVTVVPIGSVHTLEAALARPRKPDTVLVDLAEDSPFGLQEAAASAQHAFTFALLNPDAPATRLPPGVRELAPDALPDLPAALAARQIPKMPGAASWSEQAEFFASLLERLDDALWICDARGEHTHYLSPAFTRVWGVDEARVMQDAHHWMDYIHPHDRARYHAEFQANAARDHAFVLEYRVLRPDGAVRTVRDQIYPIRDAAGRRCRFGGFIHDITEERRMQEETRLNHRLEAVGQLASGIAHEINTPAQFIGDNLRFVKGAVGDLLRLIGELTPLASGESTASAAQVAEYRRLADVDFLAGDLPDAMAQSIEGVERIATIVRAMREFSHPGSDEAAPASINEIIGSAVTVSRGAWKYIAELEQSLDPQSPVVTCHRQAISQVIVNLIVNAAHAIEASAGAAGSGRIKVSTLLEGDWVRIEVDDNGCGMEPGTMTRIFDPFFTTKEVGKGTGQGLALAWRTIVEDHGGQIEVDSEPGAGTTLRLYLPLEPAVAAPGNT